MIHGRRFRWRGPQPTRGEEQIANAPDDLFPLSPVSEAASEQASTDWAAVLPSNIPFIWEARNGRAEEELVD